MLFVNNFEYDGINSKKYGLFFGHVDTERLKQICGNLEYNQVFYPSLNRQEIHGVNKDEFPLSFDLEIISAEPISYWSAKKIKKWLFNSPTYKKLYASRVQDKTVERINGEEKRRYVECVFTNPEAMFYADGLHGWKCTCTLSSGWAFQDEIEVDLIANATLGKNRLCYPFYINYKSTSETFNVVDNKDGTISFNGTLSTEETYYCTIEVNLKKAQLTNGNMYTFTAYIEGTQIGNNITLYDFLDKIPSVKNGESFLYDGSGFIFIDIRFIGSQFNNEYIEGKIKLQLEDGNCSTNWEPFTNSQLGTIHVDSDNGDYIYPAFTFSAAATTNPISPTIVNTSDNNRTMEIKDIPAQTEVYVDSAVGIITDNTGTSLYPNLVDQKFLRLVNGDNVLQISGISELIIKYQNVRYII